MKKLVSIVFTIDETLDEMEIIKNVKNFLKKEFRIDNFGHHVKPISKR